ncbi:MAG: hypothetical protein ACK2UC_13765 [Anaerolineae bacterium]|jgi:hypothetical protein
MRRGHSLLSFWDRSDRGEDVRHRHDHFGGSQVGSVAYAHDMATPSTARIDLLAEVLLTFIRSQDQHLIPWRQVGQNGVQVVLQRPFLARLYALGPPAP